MRLLTLILLLLPCMAYSQSDWMQLGGPTGASVRALYSTNNDELVLFTDAREILRSSDQGQSWERLHDHQSSVHDRARVAVGADGTIAAKYADEALLRMLPATSEWEEVVDTDMYPIALSSDGRIVLSAGDAQYASIAPGANTIEAINNIDGSLLDDSKFCSDANGGLYFYKEAEVWHYNFESESLSSIYDQGGSPIAHLQFHPDLGLYMVKGNDLLHLPHGQEEWVSIPVPVTAELSFVHAIDAMHIMLNVAFGYSHYTTFDGGQNWNASNELLHTLSPHALHLSDGTIIFYDQHLGHYIFKNNPPSNELIRIDHSLRVSPAHYLESLGEGVLIAKNDDAHFQISEDNGISWDYLLVDGQYVVDFEQGFESGLLVRTLDDRLFLAQDLNSAWNELTSSFGYFDDMALLNDQQIAIISGGQIYSSLDGGDTWTGTNSPSGIERLEKHPAGLFVGGPSLNNLFWFQESPIHIFDPTSMNWTPTSYPTNYIAEEIEVSPTGVIFVHSTPLEDVNYLSVSHDNGVSFEHHVYPEGFDPMPSLLSIASNSLGHVFFANQNQVWKSTDYGQNWSFVADSALETPLEDHDIFIDKEGYLYYSGNNVALQRLALTTLAGAQTISGHLWRDLEQDDCISTEEDLVFAHQLIEAQSDTVSYYAYSNWQGDYNLNVLAGDFTLSTHVDHPLYDACTDELQVNIEEGLATDSVDFGFSPIEFCSLLEIDTSVPLLRRCFDNIYSVSVCNTGTATAHDAQLNVQLDEFFEYQTASLVPIEQDANNFLFALGDIAPSQCVNFNITIAVSCEAELGQEHCIEMNVSPSNDCAESYVPSVFRECQSNIGAYDPNDKRAFVNGQESSELLPSQVDQLNYHIRFQNTGTDTAFTVIVEDELSDLLDVASFKFENSSHPCSIALLPTASQRTKVVFTFDNILLPDSLTNEAASHGFVKFSIAPKAGLNPGTLIPNFADIYFDFNAPIRTNTAALVYTISSASTQLAASAQPQVFPNPFKSSVLLAFDRTLTEGTVCRWFNAQAQLVAQQKIRSPQHIWDATAMPQGLYWYQIYHKKQGIIASGKVLKQ